MQMNSSWGLLPWWNAVKWWWKRGDYRVAMRVFFGSGIAAAKWSWRFRAWEAWDHQPPTITKTFQIGD
jgi:hypothetical protein